MQRILGCWGVAELAADADLPSFVHAATVLTNAASSTKASSGALMAWVVASLGVGGRQSVE